MLRTDDSLNYCGYLHFKLEDGEGKFFKGFFRLDRAARLLECYPNEELIFNRHSIVIAPIASYNVRFVSMVADAALIGCRIPNSFYIVIRGDEHIFYADTEKEKQQWIEVVQEASKIQVGKRDSIATVDVKGGFRVEIIAGVAVKTPLEDSSFAFPVKAAAKSSSSSVNSQLSSVSSSTDGCSSSPTATPKFIAQHSPRITAPSNHKSYDSTEGCPNENTFSPSITSKHISQHSPRLAVPSNRKSYAPQESQYDESQFCSLEMIQSLPCDAVRPCVVVQPPPQPGFGHQRSQSAAGRQFLSTTTGAPMHLHLDRLVSCPTDTLKPIDRIGTPDYIKQETNSEPFRRFKPRTAHWSPLAASSEYRVAGGPAGWSGGSCRESGLGKVAGSPPDGELRRSHRLKSEVADTERTLVRLRALSLSNIYESSLSVCRKAGFCNKLGAVRKNWKRRYFKLDGYSLSYYASRRDKPPIRTVPVLDIRQVRPSIGIHVNKQNVFEVVTLGRVYYIQADTKSEMQSWIEEISKAVESVQPPKNLNAGTQTDNIEYNGDTLTRHKEIKVTDV